MNIVDVCLLFSTCTLIAAFAMVKKLQLKVKTAEGALNYTVAEVAVLRKLLSNERVKVDFLSDCNLNLVRRMF